LAVRSFLVFHVSDVEKHALSELGGIHLINEDKHLGLVSAKDAWNLLEHFSVDKESLVDCLDKNVVFGLVLRVGSGF
jgi:hypothetical protein